MCKDSWGVIVAESNGLLDFLNSPGGMGLLSAVGSGLAGARRGGRWNALGSGLLGGVQGFAQGQELQNQTERQKAIEGRQSQMFDWQKSAHEQQQAAMAKQQQQQAAAAAPTPEPALAAAADQGVGAAAGAPGYVVSAVLVHELAHLRYPDHGPEFQALIRRFPDHDRAEAFLAGAIHARSRFEV